ncbi:MetQ/NlpA family ABC transporter substrate-binding protein [Acetilactobacillus jinshanensis]|uniref:Lipoprotein n=1 Tax=Acetilactobacillus jinshanensis TaxID=1720083 RepID=A0A4P6ZLW4_9LACO|nr:MetQ/NlpA family ABC transporter substrate-binding protein [Acetilactobacillus jinshanensis]QBP18764.1 methionine ABC transporter substrate-binding protein [Acetilactobacillus jinshanensis]URL61636.1 methionine ABC transporter substrate-binding protein [uncultured bacterium]
MKKFSFFVGIVVLFIALLLIGPNTRPPKNTLVIGASNIPHAQILRHVEPQLRRKGVKLDIKVFQDYVMPNRALQGKELDANYFQTIAFLNQWNRQNHTHLVNCGSVHLEPIAIYSKKVHKLSQLRPHSKILVSSNAPDYGRILQLFSQAHLIKVKSGIPLDQANFDDIIKNPRHLIFKHSYEPKLLPEIYKNGEGDAVAINSNYAVQSGLNPKRDSIAYEKPARNSPYNNIIATRKSERHNPKIEKLLKALHSKATRRWIRKKYKSGVVPVK